MENFALSSYYTMTQIFENGYYCSNSKFNNPPSENLSLRSRSTRQWNCGLTPGSPFRTKFGGYLGQYIPPIDSYQPQS